MMGKETRASAPKTSPADAAAATSNALKLWQAIYRDKLQDAQALALTLPPRVDSKFVFDPTVTSSLYDAAAGMLPLKMASPTFKTLQSDKRVHLTLIDPMVNCCGILNSRQSKTLGDPVMRICRKVVKGGAKCLVTGHENTRLAPPEARWLIECPRSTEQTHPAALSTPYLNASDLPSDFGQPGKGERCLQELVLLIGVWRTILELYPGKEALLSSGKPSLSVTTEFQAQTSGVESEPGALKEEAKEVIAGATIPSQSGPGGRTDADEVSNPGFDDAYTEYCVLNGQASVTESQFYRRERGIHSQREDEDGSDMSGEGSIAVSATPSRPPRAIQTFMGDVDFMNKFKGIYRRLQVLEARDLEVDDVYSQLELKIKRMKSEANREKERWRQERLDLEQRFESTKLQLRTEVDKSVTSRAAIVQLSRDIEDSKHRDIAMNTRVTSLELDLRAPSGALQDALLECKRAAAAADTGAIELGGTVFRSEYDVLALIEPLNFQHRYQVFADVNAMFFLAEGGVSTFSEAMTASKAIKGADFPNMFVAKMNTSHIIAFPPIMGTKGKSGDESALTWTSGWRSHAAYTGGSKEGAKAHLKRELVRSKAGMTRQISALLPIKKFPTQNAVALSMLDLSCSLLTELLDAVSTFYESLVEAGVSEPKAWGYSQDFVTRIFRDVDLTRAGLGEEDVESGMIWASMTSLMKFNEFSRSRFVEHPAVAAMLLHSLLELKAGDESKELEAAAKKALEKASASIAEIEKITKQVHGSHTEATNALNQIKQVKEKLKKLEK